MKTEILPGGIIGLLADHHLGVLATSGDAYPHASLISIAFSADYSFLIFPTLRSTRKYVNLLGNNHVSVLLDNRSQGIKPDECHALTISGSADSAEAHERPELEAVFLNVHPDMKEFLLMPDTEIIKVSIEKVRFVEGVLKIMEFIVTAG